MSDLSVSSLFTVKDKVAVVTGGASGIGFMMASAFVQNGAKVYIASRNEEQLKESAEELQKIGPGSCEYIVANLGTKAGCDEFTDAIKQKESKVHILINNAGAVVAAPYEQFPERGWDDVMAVNVKSIFYLTQGLTELLAKDATSYDPGRVINVSSVNSKITDSEGGYIAPPGIGRWSYSTSKAAVNYLTTTLASTLITRFITVNCICPGFFPSKMSSHLFKRSGEKMIGTQPMGRVGEPRDMAGVALFLTSPASAHVSGANIVLDGGSLVSNRVRM